MAFFVANAFVRCLGTRDLTKLQAADRATSEKLEDGALWQECARLEVGDLIVDPKLFEARHRGAMMRLYDAISAANASWGSLVHIASIDEAIALERHLRSSISARDAHESIADQEAYIAVGKFDLVGRQAMGVFPFGVTTGSSIRGLPAGFFHLKMRLRGNRLVYRARYKVVVFGSLRLSAPLEDLRYTMNVTCACPDLSLSYRGLELRLDGQVRASNSGLWHNKSETHLCDGRPAEPVLCVLTILDGERAIQTNFLTTALHIEMPGASRVDAAAAGVF
eukprot:TRINITY_DN5643_c0_g1_i2.p1 TRINITY_DN5643_c0_g1~~TRINITY_DN5643_c0_g1_i2.p1  ORF type:complete len:297 (+),score=34.97 TRINITY_DN5643_c0_g1_i2:55-891(+)